MPTRGDVHRLVDELSDEQLPAAFEALQHVRAETEAVPRRRFRTTGSFAGERDLGTRAKEIARDARNQSA